MNRRHILTVGALLSTFLLSGCIGTDYIEGPPVITGPHLEVVAAKTTILVGEHLDLHARYDDGAGRIMDVPAVWTVSDPSVAVLDNDALITGVQPGSVTITASAVGFTSPVFTLTVIANPNLLPRTGTFISNPATSYHVEGTVKLERSSDGSGTLSFGDDFVSSNGPRLHVYLSPDDRIGPNSIDLGSLQKTSGEQTYLLPTGINPDDYSFVQVHCLAVNISFGSAMLSQ